MLTNLLVNVADKTRTVSIGEAALYALLGFAVVCLGIAFLILVIWLVGKVMSKSKANGSLAEKKVETAKTVTPAPTIEGEDISEETVAVITAAIMAYYQQNKPKCEFTVKRIKRI